MTLPRSPRSLSARARYPKKKHKPSFPLAHVWFVHVQAREKHAGYVCVYTVVMPPCCSFAPQQEGCRWCSRHTMHALHGEGRVPPHAGGHTFQPLNPPLPPC